jgi:hypothetical protein
MADIIFTIDPDGNITITVEGAKGKDCTALTAELEEALGVVLDREFTTEYYEEATDQLHITLGKDD